MFSFPEPSSSARPFHAAAVALAAASAGALLLWRQRRVNRIERLDPALVAHRRWMQRMQAFVFDIDGVVHINKVPVQGAANTLDKLRAAGKRVIFVTNAGSKRPADVLAEFSKMGIHASAREVMTAAVATSEFLRLRGMEGRTVYVIGMDPLGEELAENARVRPVGMESHAGKDRADFELEQHPVLQPPKSEVAAVVVGADFNFNYYKLALAANYLHNNPACLFVLSNPDPKALLAPGVILPAAGSIAASIACAAGRVPDMVCGKPSASLARQIVATQGLDPSSTCMVGDRVDTDIAFGNSVGMDTLFVESGTMTLQEAEAASGPERPRFIAASLATLSDLL